MQTPAYPAGGQPRPMGGRLRRLLSRKSLLAAIGLLLFGSQIALYAWNRSELESNDLLKRDVDARSTQNGSHLLDDRLSLLKSVDQMNHLDAVNRQSTDNNNRQQPQFTRHLPDTGTGNISAAYSGLVPEGCVIGREVESALERAISAGCKGEIVDVACRHQRNQLFPLQLTSSCPLLGNDYGVHVGCFKDSVRKRILSDHMLELPDTNSPSVCINHCLRSGFEYAGVEFGSECFCSFSFPVTSAKRVRNNDCHMACPGNKSSTCGAHLTISVYRTGFIVRVPHNAVLQGSNSSQPRPRSASLRIAFVLTVNGRAVRQVRRLLRTIYRPHHFYFIHVDKRQEYLHRELSAIARRLPNVRMSTRRFATIWGGASLLSMLLSCMEELLAVDDWNWDYFLNLSESDYPIKTVEELELFLVQNKGRNFVKSHGKDTPKFMRKQGLNMLFHECDNHMWRLGARNPQDGIRIDGGSDWVCLHRDFAQYLTGAQDGLLRGLRAYWAYSLLPAESFFHTVLQNSLFCATVVNNNLHLTNWRRRQGCKCQYKHIVDWCGCSPNDFLPEDIHKLQGMHTRPIFFARKFESIVSQEVVNMVDTTILGHSVPDTSFWLNEFHHADSPESSTDVIHSYYQSFARIAALRFQSLASPPVSDDCRLTVDRLLEGTVYRHQDVLQGVVVTFEINEEVRVGGGPIRAAVVEALFQRRALYRVVSEANFPKQLLSVEVGTNFDPKEEIFRNSAGLLGPHSDLVLRFTWDPGSNVSLTAAFIDPAGVLAASYDVTVIGASAVHAHHAELARPLRPGRWLVRVLAAWVVVAESTFVVLPLSHEAGGPMGRDAGVRLHSGPGRPYMVEDFSAVAALLLGDLNVAGMKRTAEVNAAKHGSELLGWIDELVWESWVFGEGCVVTGGGGGVCGAERRLQGCRETKWSTKHPDPKSEILGVDAELPSGVDRDSLR